MFIALGQLFFDAADQGKLRFLLLFAEFAGGALLQEFNAALRVASRCCDLDFYFDRRSWINVQPGRVEFALMPIYFLERGQRIGQQGRGVVGGSALSLGGHVRCPFMGVGCAG
jgi:hypothetical protein